MSFTTAYRASASPPWRILWSCPVWNSELNVDRLRSLLVQVRAGAKGLVAAVPRLPQRGNSAWKLTTLSLRRENPAVPRLSSGPCQAFVCSAKRQSTPWPPHFWFRSERARCRVPSDDSFWANPIVRRGAYRARSARSSCRHCNRPRCPARIAEAIVRPAATGLARLGDPEPPAGAAPTRRSVAMQAREGAIKAIASGWR